MLGLVWGGGKWFAEGVSGVDAGKGLRKRGDRTGRRIVQGRGEQGTAYVTGPSGWRWPDVVVVNGTSFEREGEGYRSAEGKELNATVGEPCE